MTVEISILFPVIFMVLCTIFYMCFYFHDRVAVQAFLYRFCIYTEYKNISEEEAERLLVEEAEKRMVLSNSVSAGFDKNDNTIEAKICIRTELPGILSGNRESKSIVRVTNWKKSDCIRKYRFVKEAIE